MVCRILIMEVSICHALHKVAKSRTTPLNTVIYLSKVNRRFLLCLYADT
jgi:hypothetical protein